LARGYTHWWVVVVEKGRDGLVVERNSEEGAGALGEGRRVGSTKKLDCMWGGGGQTEVAEDYLKRRYEQEKGKT